MGRTIFYIFNYKLYAVRSRKKYITLPERDIYMFHDGYDFEVKPNFLKNVVTSNYLRDYLNTFQRQVYFKRRDSCIIDYQIGGAAAAVVAALKVTALRRKRGLASLNLSSKNEWTYMNVYVIKCSSCAASA